MSSAHCPTFPSLHIRHSSFSNASVASPMSQLILQPFHCFTYVTVHSPTLLLLLLHHKLHLIHLAQLILQAFRHFTYVATHSPNLPSLYLRHCSFSNPSFCFSYVTNSSLNSPGKPSMMHTHTHIYIYIYSLRSVPVWPGRHVVLGPASSIVYTMQVVISKPPTYPSNLLK